MTKTQKIDKQEGIVIEALPNTLFRVRLHNDEQVLAYLSGRMRMYRVRILVGDRVDIERTPGDQRARIIYRYK